MSHAVVKADKDELIPCPYDPVHMISQMRFPYHLIKCRKNHNGREYQQCPFDAKHVILRSEYAKHVEGCDKRAIIEPQLVLDDTHTIEIPESKAHEIQAALSNEWDIPVHSAGATNSFSGGQHEVNSFRHFDTRSDHGSSNSFAGASNGNSFSSFKAPVGASAQNNNSYNGYQSHKEAAAQPSYSSYHDNNQSHHDNNYQSPSGARAQPSSTPNFAPQPTVTVPQPAIPRKPRASSKKGCSSSDSCGSSEYSCDLQKPSSVGRGRAAVGGAVTQIPVEGNKMGPHSYEIKPTFPGHAECYNSPPSPPLSSSAIGRGCDGGKAPAPGPPSSFGRGRANPRFDDEIPVRRPGFTERQSLEKDKQKYLKKIRECKALEDRLHAGEVLEENQVAKVALQATYMNELNKISKKLEKMDLCS